MPPVALKNCACPDPVEPLPGTYEVLRRLVDRQTRTLAAVFPEMVVGVDLRPIEHWCVWGALSELLADGDRVQEAFVEYVCRREGLSTARALELACVVRRATMTDHSLADGVALAGREAMRSGFDRCFLSAALYLRQPHVAA